MRHFAIGRLLVAFAFGGLFALAPSPAVASDVSSRLYNAFHFAIGGTYRIIARTKRTVGKPEGLKLIGAGFSRTGTKSIDKALQMAGYKVYDILSIFDHDHLKRWIKAAEDWKLRNDLSGVRELLEEIESFGYTATLDMPMNMFALAFAELRPEAKVLFSIRDTEEKWVESWFAFHWAASFLHLRPWIWVIGKQMFLDFGDMIGVLEGFTDIPWPTYPEDIDRPLPWYEVLKHHPMDNEEGRQRWIDMHKRFRRSLEESVPEDQLLIFNVKQGWEPLAKFLGFENEPYTEEPFPHINDRSILMFFRSIMDMVAIGLPVWILGTTFILARVLMAIFGKKGKGRPKAKVV